MKYGVWLVFLVSLFSVCVSAEEILLRADDWCPYNCEPTGEKQGFMVDIANEIFAKAGHSIDYQLRPWTRAVREAQDGKIHGIIGAVPNEVPDFIFPEQELAESTMVFWVNAENPWRYTALDSLKGIRIAVIDQYSYGETLDAYIKAHREEKGVIVSYGADAFDNNLKLLQRGVVDAIAADRDVMSYYLYNRGEQHQFVDAGEINAAPIYIAFSPVHPESKTYADLLSQGMIALRASGELDPILERYGIHDWKK